MVRTVSVRLDDETLRKIEDIAHEFKTDRSETVRRVLEAGLRQHMTERALDLLGRGRISVGKAAEMAHLSIYEMLELAEARGLPYGYSDDDLRKDLADLGLGVG